MRRLLFTTLASLAALGGVAFAARAIRPAGEKARFTVAVTPARQSVVQGRSVDFRVDVHRGKGFTGAVKLRVSGLPRGTRPRWLLADGTRSAVVPSTETGAILSLKTSARTPLGSRRVKVLATRGRTRRSRLLTLIVERPSALRFSLRVSPARQIVPQGAAATYTFRVVRARGFRGRVTVRAHALARGAIAAWTPGALTVATGADYPLGSERLVLYAASRVRGKTVRRHAVVVLTVVGATQVAPTTVDATEFAIGGDLEALLRPGSGAPLDLVVTNPHGFDIVVTALSVSVGAGTTNPGCGGEANYAVTQYSGGYPLVLHPGITRLSALFPSSAVWPQIFMYDLPTNQDACQGAVLSLDYSGTATR